MKYLGIITLEGHGCGMSRFALGAADSSAKVLGSKDLAASETSGSDLGKADKIAFGERVS
jgi:hypothetical protein